MSSTTTEKKEALFVRVTTSVLEQVTKATLKEKLYNCRTRDFSQTCETITWVWATMVGPLPIRLDWENKVSTLTIDAINPEHCTDSLPPMLRLELVRRCRAETSRFAAFLICTSSNTFDLTDVDDV